MPNVIVQQNPNTNWITFECEVCGVNVQLVKNRVDRRGAMVCTNRTCKETIYKERRRAEYQDTQEKFCPSCKETKPLAEFALHARTASGRNAYCRGCMSQKAKKHFPARAIKRAAIKAEWVLKLGNRCFLCGAENLPICCYDFHHRDPHDKSFDVGSHLTNKNRDVKSEIAKCDLICANCHHIKHASADYQTAVDVLS